MRQKERDPRSARVRCLSGPRAGPGSAIPLSRPGKQGQAILELGHGGVSQPGAGGREPPAGCGGLAGFLPALVPGQGSSPPPGGPAGPRLRRPAPCARCFQPRTPCSAPEGKTPPRCKEIGLPPEGPWGHPEGEISHPEKRRDGPGRRGRAANRAPAAQAHPSIGVRQPAGACFSSVR